MNWNIYKMSMYQNRKGFIVWLIALPALVFLGMAFYPPISESLAEMSALFENPMMKSLIGLFAMGPNALASLMGFYVTYASIYVVLTGGIYAVLMSAGDVAGEFRDRTSEFLFTCPVKRRMILISKWLAVQTRILIMCIVLAGATLMSFNMFDENAPLEYFEHAHALEEVEAVLKERPQGISQVWTLNDSFFTGWVTTNMTSELEGKPSQVGGMTLNGDEAEALLEKALSDPNSFFDEIAQNPEAYMIQLGIPEADKAMFLEAVEGGQKTYEAVVERYRTDAEFHFEMFTENPSYFMQALNMRDAYNRFTAEYPKGTRPLLKLVAPYSPVRILKLHVYIFFFMTAMNALGTLLSVWMKQAKHVTSAAVGLVLGLYFFSTLSKISPSTAWLSALTPFGQIDQSLTGTRYDLKLVNLFVLSAEAGICLLLSVRHLEKRDI